MAKFRVPIYGTPQKSTTVDTDATNGAVVGTNLRFADGTLVKASDFGGGSSRPPAYSIDSTNDLPEGSRGLYFTSGRAQSAVGGIFQDTDDILLSYDASVPSISADLVPTGISAGTYGSPSPSFVAFQVDSKGRLIEASQVSLIAGNGISFDTDPDTGAITISVNGFVSNLRITQDGSTRTTRAGNFRVTR